MNVRQFYTFIEFFGYVLQIMPVLFLFFVPYEQKFLKISRKSLSVFLAVFTFAISLGTSCFLGSQYGKIDDNLLMLLGNLIFCVFLLAGTGIYFFCVKKSAGFRLLTYMLVLQYAVFIYSSAEIGTKFIRVPWYCYGFLPYSETGVMIYLVGTVLTFPLVYRFLRYFGRVRFQKVGKKSIRLISVCSICSFLLYICVLQGEMILSEIHRDTTTEIYLSAGLVCLVAMDFLMYYIYFRCLSIEEEKEEMSLRLATEEMQYQSLTDKIREDKRMQHNMRHHFRTLATFLEGEQYDEMQEYLQKYLKDWEEFSSQTICRNPMLNSILSYYFSVAEKKGIRLETDIDVKEHYPFAVTDMTVLLGNAMENAVEACTAKDAENPFINLMIKQHKNALLIQIENSSSESESPVLEKGRNTSTKQGRSHGYGLSSIEMIAENYQGSMEYWTKDGIFTLRIVLNIPPDNKEETRKAGWKRERE